MIKKNKTTVLLIGIFLFTTAMISQSHKLALSVGAGYVPSKFGGFAATVDYKPKEYDFIQLNLQASLGDIKVSDEKISNTIYSLQAGYFFDILRNNERNYAIAVGVGGAVGSQSINEGKKELNSTQTLTVEPDSILFGGYAGIDIDIFLISTITLNIKANQTYYVNTDFGEFNPYAGLGVKLILK